MNKPLRNVTVVLLLCYVSLFVRLNMIQVINAEEIDNTPGNSRKVERLFGAKKGKIVTSDGEIVAFSDELSESATFKYRRRYPQGELYAHAVGYVSLSGSSRGVERQYSEQLTGLKFGQQFKSLLAPKDGNRTEDLVLALDHGLQTAAKQALGEVNGSVVAIDPRNGDIKALWSYPSYNPDPLTSFDTSEVNELFADLGAASANAQCSDTPICPKTYQERFSPGSTFKVVVAAAALSDSSLAKEDFFSDPSSTSYRPPRAGESGTIGNYAGSACGGDLRTMLARSCNIWFAQTAAEKLGPEKMVIAAESFGFNQDIPLDAPSGFITQSNYPSLSAFGELTNSERYAAPISDESPKLAQTAIGQNDVQATPLHMALIASAFANEGKIFAPRIAKGSYDSLNGSLEQYNEFKSDVWLEPIEKNIAEEVSQGMIQAVENGTATALRKAGYRVGAKTGTAEIPRREGETVDTVHPWVIAFAGPEGGEAEIAIAVLVEKQPSGSTGGKVAAPIAKALFDEHFSN